MKEKAFLGRDEARHLICSSSRKRSASKVRKGAGIPSWGRSTVVGTNDRRPSARLGLSLYLYLCILTIPSLTDIDSKKNNIE